MPTYNTRKARRIIAHLRRYGMDGIAAKALARCGTFNPYDFAKAALPSHIQTLLRDIKRRDKAQRREARAELIYEAAFPSDHTAMAWALAEQGRAKPYLA